MSASSKYKAMTYKAAHAWEPMAKQRGVSKVARSSRGFMRAYEKAGSFVKLPQKWKDKRHGFIARHMAQAKKENLWKGSKPSRRALALIMWAYMPPGKPESVRPNPNLLKGGKGARLEHMGRRARRNPADAMVMLPADFFSKIAARQEQLKAARAMIYEQSGIWIDDPEDVNRHLNAAYVKWVHANMRIVGGRKNPPLALWKVEGGGVVVSRSKPSPRSVKVHIYDPDLYSIWALKEAAERKRRKRRPV